ncbi:5'-methylthioadenosine/S-adenosylhomocysteine nucleosidase [Mycoplasma mycoides subsp. capri]|uniref:5'-methylthioadenosine/S-adenosylhomocysteine nucleosidase n=1 Tax=Mycoplasma mycoides TaxID=2102 RepID=UPI00223F1CEF|nr:5'-methylthioadenosine/S-adenosylhomocysteine nucleosidase [Mycoplasma mycoides]QVJ95830.1 5'-methylthioadenosine/S-adenosylhomocysteine nucleosidase [Mycoplasma mycoides subsp. capri]QVJ96706.1 5'-methylthioadenosine/S-adenosylhomocysteine nucleosidase [Mycoplasma mycoides subsp. capri]QVJ97598.1 5'-methylthioadenosine/S-adenosylhomocysteine nucleosidase [Mycoplasma mycoides subsp. capri]QVK00591.1 5'-methylthioadenosine/S-adenosylhomocysteine nucleosidase [Mycoplasma mycoides subsp. capri]
MKLIISAMYEELAYTLKKTNAQLIIDNDILKLYQYQNILLAISKIGLVNASCCLSYILNHYQIDQILNIGTCCSLNQEYKQNDIVIVNKAYYFSVDVTGFSYSYGQIPKLPKYFLANNFLNLSLDYKICNIASGDVFINKSEHLTQFINKINDKIDIVDMEACSLFHVAYLYKKPISSIKVISDVMFVSDSNMLQFDQFINKASKKIYQILNDLYFKID